MRMAGRMAGRQLRWASTLALACGAAVMLQSCTSPAPRSAAQLTGADPMQKCAALGQMLSGNAAFPGLVITSSRWMAQGTEIATRAGKVTDLPDHCVVEGSFAPHEGRIGGPYRIGFRMRLPGAWNGRYFFQGGGGSNGVVGDATGFNGVGNPVALVRGYAVIAQDSGHDNDRNTVPDHQGDLVFGYDPRARANYGHASLKPVSDLGHLLMNRFYGRDSETNLFWGCSKGGQEGMAFAQRYPDEFDGIVAMAPGMSLPRAALAEAWDTQAIAGIARARGQAITIDTMRSLISPAQYQLVASAALKACDALDGTADGIIGAVWQCTTARVQPELRAAQCRDGSSGACLEPAQVDALVKIMDGARDRTGKPLYAPWVWDSGIAASGWAVWKTGTPQGPPSLNVVLGAGSLSAVFSSPPTPLSRNADDLLAWQLSFDFDRDSRRIYAVAPPFETSPWQDVGMRSANLSAFRAHGGKLIVPHGASDPVFSLLDTIAWWNEVNARERGSASEFARVFPVPGMNHCGGGPATDRFDSLTALEQWVLAGKAPGAIEAKAGPETPWPGRSMPLCPYPQFAVRGAGGRYSCRLQP